MITTRDQGGTAKLMVEAPFSLVELAKRLGGLPNLQRNTKNTGGLAFLVNELPKLLLETDDCARLFHISLARKSNFPAGIISFSAKRLQSLRRIGELLDDNFHQEMRRVWRRLGFA